MNDSNGTADSNPARKRFEDHLYTTAHTQTVHFLLPSDDGDHILAEIGPGKNARLTSASIRIEDKKFFKRDVLEGKVREVYPFPVCFVEESYDAVEEDIDNPGRDVYQVMWIVHPASEFPAMKEPLKWIHRDDVSSYEWVDTMRSLRPGHTVRRIQHLLEDLEWKVEARAKPWEALGFYKKLMRWAQEILQRKNMVMEGRIGYLDEGDDGRVFTCTARVRDDGRLGHTKDRSEVVFIKSTFPQAREVGRTVAVASMFKDLVPEILGFDVERGMLMQRDAGNVRDEPFDQRAFIDTVLRMQRLSVDRIGELEANGLRVMDAEWLEAKVESILYHGIYDEFFEDQENTLTWCEDKRKTLDGMRSKIELLRKMCREISQLKLPRTLVHGDCHSGNIGRPITTSEGKLYQMFDWARTHIGSPLTDLDRVLPLKREEAEVGMSREAGVRQVCEQWKQLARFQYAEVERLLDSMGSLNLLIVTYMIEEQFDLYMTRAEEEATVELQLYDYKRSIFDALESMLRVLGDVNERIDCESQGDS